jgi:hypothetical protein
MNSPIHVAENLGASWLGYFSPEFLFLSGDRGGHWELLFPPGFGMLLPEQALLIGFALFAALAGRRRRLVVLLLGWLVLAAVPAAMLVSAGAWMPEGGGHHQPTPISLLKVSPPNIALTPALLFSHPEARHDLLAIVPWMLLSAVGFVTLIECSSDRRAFRIVAVGLVVLGITFHGVRFVRAYFHEYPILAAPYFCWGLDEAIRAAAKSAKSDESDAPIIVSNRIDQPYIQVLFDESYPPALLQREGLRYQESDYPLLLHPHAKPFAFGRYIFEDWQNASRDYTPAIFVVPGPQPVRKYYEQRKSSDIPRPKLMPLLSVNYPDGSVAYRVFKTEGASCRPPSSVSLKADMNTKICSLSATTPPSGGPWRAVVAWNATVKNLDPREGSIECYLSDGASDLLPVRTWVPGSGELAWNITEKPLGDKALYGDNMAKTWSWQCKTSDSLTILPGTNSKTMPYAEVYFVSAVGNGEESTASTRPR